MDREDVAVALEGAADGWVQDHLEWWPDDEEMQAVARQDAQTFYEAAALLRGGNLKAGARKALGVDTIVRDLIPQKPYEALMEWDER
jgi:hypothetical protein